MNGELKRVRRAGETERTWPPLVNINDVSSILSFRYLVASAVLSPRHFRHRERVCVPKENVRCSETNGMKSGSRLRLRG